MIIKILSSASQDFHGVKYNDKKMQSGDGELMAMRNFPSFINKDSSQETVRDYFKSISQSKSGRVKKPQFHAVVSTKFREHSKEELTKIADEVMKDLGYGKQPYILVYHNDTDNNHIHIVSSRVDKTTGKKINDSYEKIRSQQALSNAMERIYGIKSEKKLELLLTYKIGTQKQLETLLNREGFRVLPNKLDRTKIDIVKNGVVKKTIENNTIAFNNSEDDKRKRQIYAILNKYKNIYSNKVFRVIDDRELRGNLEMNKEVNIDDVKIKVEFESDLQHHLKKMFGLDIVFHNKDDRDPFGYTIIDHKTNAIFKGSEIMKMGDLFEFTEERMDKRLFEKMKDYNVKSAEEKAILLESLNETSEYSVKDFMIFNNRKRLKKDDYKQVQSDTIDFIKSKGVNENVSIAQTEDGKLYAIHSKMHHIQELQSLVGKNYYDQFVNPGKYETTESYENENEYRGQSSIDELMREMMKSAYGKTDPYDIEKQNKKRKKRKK